MSEVDGAGHRVRVQFPSKNGVVSPWLDVLVRDTNIAKDYGLPGLGAQVAVLLDEHGESGLVLGSLYSTADAATAADAKVRRLDAADGTRIEYDATKHELNVVLAAGATVNITGGIVNIGEGAEPVALAPAVEDRLSKLEQFAGPSGHAHPTALGPSGPPTPPLEPGASVASSVLKAKG